ncbi:flagellar biosynthetic protein FliR [Teichococcus aestuarii]|uniref:flagellar biosynthetic protein FliR n=1 Tax=Teichococcus aestuarii TaxID=568898 RepID=UPI00360B0B57
MSEAEWLGQLPLLAFQAALLMARIGACGMVLPGLGEADVPATLRLGLALAVVALLLPVLAPGLPPEPAGIGGLAALVATEVAVGLWLGWLARLASFALVTAGQAIGFLIGLSSLLGQDPVQGAQGLATGRLMGMAAAILALSTGLYALPLRALAESYALLPAGAPLPAGPAAEAVVAATAGSFALAMRLAAPLLLLAVLLQAGSGLLARAAPQAQIFVIAAPAQTLAGSALLAALLPLILEHWLAAAQAAFSVLPGLG